MISQGLPTLDQFIRKIELGREPFDRKVPILLENSRYILKTVDHFDELHRALRLRHDVFFAWGLGKKLKFELDVDQYDLDSDHLIVIDKQNGQIVGNYRMRCSSFHSGFYSESEFVMNELLENTVQGKVEIGRACIHPGHRSGSVIQLLWRGLMLYMRATNARYLFGCSSISTRVGSQVEFVWNYLHENGLLNSNFNVYPKNPYILKNPLSQASGSTLGTPSSSEMELPPLLYSYIRSGAKILGPPAYDPEFECADFFTLLDLNDLTEKRARRYDAFLQPAIA